MHKILAKTLFLGKKTIFLPECPSTNSAAMDFLKIGSASHGTLILTDNQTQGRGQRGNTWHAEPKQNLTFSLIIKPGFIVPAQQFQLHLMVSLALVDVLDEFVSPVRIKWPNDIYIGKKKIAGILIENNLRGGKIENAVIGIGLNVNQTIFPHLSSATSLCLVTDKVYDREELLELIVLKIEKYFLKLKNGDVQSLKQAYLNSMMGYNEALKFEDASGVFTGIIRGVSEAGQLIVERAGNQQHYDLKEVKYPIE